jgi:hypothetical protein
MRPFQIKSIKLNAATTRAADPEQIAFKAIPDLLN